MTANANVPWTGELEKQLLEYLVSNEMKTAPAHFGRTRGAIRSRLRRIAKAMDKEGKSEEEISRITHMTPKDWRPKVKSNETEDTAEKKQATKPAKNVKRKRDSDD